MLPRLLLLLSLLLAGAVAAEAQDDPRLTVRIDYEAGQALPLNDAIAQALPLLWDRIVTREARDTVPDTDATTLLLRAVPDANGVTIEFHPQRVFGYLKQQQIACLEQQPKFRLMVHMWNQNGVSMEQSARLMLQYAEKTVAARWGIAIADDAPALVLTWRWLDTASVNLQVRGNSALPESSETRDFGGGDPLNQLKPWLEEVLLAARDATVAPAADVVTGEEPGKRVSESGIEAVLTIDRVATLPEQVILEQALAQHPKIEALVPRFLSRESRQYTVRIKGTDDQWVTAWLRAHGMDATSTPQGWTVH